MPDKMVGFSKYLGFLMFFCAEMLLILTCSQVFMLASLG